MPRFSQEYLDRVRQANPIDEVIGERVALQKNGKNFKACCPFHNEKTPSFYVTPDRGIFKCFGCGKGGNVFQFLIEYEGLSFPEAVTQLAERANIPPEGGQGLDDSALARISERQRRHKRLALINKTALEFFQKILMTPRGAAGQKYLAERGVSEEAIRAFRLGFAPDAWDELCAQLRKAGYKDEELIASGVALEGAEGKTCYDRFRNRVIFPIWDHAGEVVAFGGRAIDGSEPKYLNTAETEIYRKSQVLFALNFAKDAIKNSRKTVLLCEGYLDVVMLAQNRFVNAVASCGTSLTGEQAKLLKRFADTCVIVYDGDAAGQKAALRALPLLQEAGLSVYVAPLSGNEDPDSFLRKFGSDAFKEVLNKRVPGFTFAMNSLSSNRDLTSVQERYALAKELFPYLDNVSGEGLKLELLNELSAFTKVPLSSLNLDYNAYLKQRSFKKRSEQEKEKEKESTPSVAWNGLLEEETPSPAETDFLALFLSVPDAMDFALENLDLDFLRNNLVRRLASRASHLRNDGLWNGADTFLNECDDEEREALAGILTTASLPPKPEKNSDADKPYWLRRMTDYINVIRKTHYQAEIRRLREVLKITSDPKITAELLGKINIYLQRTKDVSNIRTFKTIARENESKLQA